MPKDAEDFDDVGITLAMPAVKVQKNVPPPPFIAEQPSDRVVDARSTQPTTEARPESVRSNTPAPSQHASEPLPIVEATVVLPFAVYTAPEPPPTIVYDAVVATPIPLHATVDIAPPLYATIPALRPTAANAIATTWQYCEIQLHAGVHDEQQTLTHYPFYLQLTINYLAPVGVLTERVTEETDDQSRPKYLWGKLMGLLGMAGWDMVTEDRGAVQDRKLVQLRAYFKRQVTIYKPINEPNIIHFL